ncbi:transglycosylase domain-containing protein [Timonella senegalensis]|uniref:transglycosylase domain-containing protein n=1 Tax=Timonella senegalensis TaxID=1465825 RepID=UPI0003170DA9|nr:transglycosylase domain-containing protein [Timonella senegalensis]
MSNSAHQGPTGNGSSGSNGSWANANSGNSGASGLSSLAGTNRSRKSLSPFQVAGLLLMFLVLAVIGGILAAAMVVPVAAGVSTVTKTATDTFYEIPTELDIDTPSQVSKIYAADGKTVLATYYAENRTVVPLDKISMNLQNAVIATEDKRFWSHGGVDIQGITRAAVSQKGGGSTLTQQYVKNVLITKASREGDSIAVESARAGTMERKLKEAKLAINVEKTKSKEEILAGYLNIAQFGTKVYGAEAASQYYFSKSASKLSVVEAATIAGITQRPSTFDPTINPEESERRRNTVLTLMLQQDYISQDEYNEAIATKLEDTLKVKKSAIANGCEGAGANGFFCDYVTKTIMKDPAFGETAKERMDLLYRGGLRIVTTLDLDKQKKAYEVLQSNIPAKNENMIATALTTVEPGTGKIVVMTQNRKYNPSAEKKKGTTSVNYNAGPDMGGSNGFQVGSTFKTFVLAEWFRSGHTLLESVDATKRPWRLSEFHASCTGFGGEDWNPSNSDGQATGRRTVQQAVATSINTAFVNMTSKLDLCKVADTATAIGFKGTTHPMQSKDFGERQVKPDEKGVYPTFPTPAMVLGTQDSTPLYMANAYATFANDGVYCDPIAITKVTDVNGNKYKVPKSKCKQVIEPSVANAVNYALTKVVSPGGGAPVAGIPGRQVAGKTGTTNNNVAAWFIGYTPQLSTAIWVGNPDSNKVKMQNIMINGRYHRNVYGSTVAAPMWKQFMTYALEGEPVERFNPIAQAQLGVVEKPPAAEKEEGDEGSSESSTENGNGRPGGRPNGGNNGGGNGGGNSTPPANPSPGASDD